MTVIAMRIVMTVTARMTTSRMNSIRDRERNCSSFEPSSVVVDPLIPSELLIPSETVDKVVAACSLSLSLVLNKGIVVDNAVLAVEVGMLDVEIPSNGVVIVQESPINGNLCSAN